MVRLTPFEKSERFRPHFDNSEAMLSEWVNFWHIPRMDCIEWINILKQTQKGCLSLPITIEARKENTQYTVPYLTRKQQFENELEKLDEKIQAIQNRKPEAGPQELLSLNDDLQIYAARKKELQKALDYQQYPLG